MQPGPISNLPLYTTPNPIVNETGQNWRGVERTVGYPTLSQYPSLHLDCRAIKAVRVGTCVREGTCGAWFTEEIEGDGDKRSE
ncbi:hypothetical protein AVEN_58883-1 [Araneus ventricosus]|uniref:Uncharacterized protein n=1 Tax=Araneus ventricosus TaxID=182803 RepID=A0A4Y2SJD2_ARAVE|nr:hypothetical protein AVEN_146021-1 [Araneus ventricosus]GBN87373.1 hypothetical protein AVEN_173740-1 [Araneus ventricosus]GBN89772.1 hypothetical protein AVEN_58883-1 [Araneus ventricosus]